MAGSGPYVGAMSTRAPLLSAFLLLVPLPAPALLAQAPAARVPPEAAAIEARALLAHATFLASDALRGRDTGSPGQEAAARYVATRFEQWGLEPLGDEAGPGRSFFQS